MPSLIAVLGANISPFTRELNRARGEAKAIGGKIAGDFKGELVGRLAGVASVAGVALGIERVVALGGKISDLSARLGISTDAVQEWDYALKQNGGTIESAVTFFEKLAVSRALAFKGGDAGKAAADAFEKLGVSMDDLKSKRIEDIGAKIAKTFDGADPQRFIESLKEVGGKSAGDMVAAFSSGFAQMMSQAREFGQVLDESTVAALDKAGDTMDRIKTSMTNDLAPIAKGVFDLWEGVKSFVIAPIVFGGRSLLDGISERKNPMQIWENATDVHARYLLDKHNEEKAMDDADEQRKKRAAENAKRQAEDSVKAIDARQNAEIQKINELMEAEMRRGIRAKMTASERAEMDRREIEMINRKIQAAKDPVEREKLKLSLERSKNELDSDMKGDSSKTAERFSNQFTAIGGFGSAMSQGPEMRRLDYERRSEGHLQKIVNLNEAAKRALEKLSRRADIPNTDVQY